MSIRRAAAAIILVALSVIPAAAQADGRAGDPRGEDGVQQGCQIPGSRNGLGDTLAIVSRITCG